MKHPTGTSKVIVVSLLLFACSTLPVFAVSIDSTDKWAWGENIGWLNWGTPEGDVDVPLGSGPLTGYVWGENIGWISLNCSNTGSCGTVSYGVTKSGDDLSGYGWGENVGWISFSCSNTASCGVVDYGVSIDSSTRDFEGFAWGENIGWISTNCSNTASCGTVDYKVSLDDDAPSGGGGGFTTPTPTPASTPAPNITVSKMPSASAVRAGDPITYSVTVQNVGSVTATGVVVSDTIDSDTVLVWVVPTPDTNNGSTFTYNLGTLAPGQTFSYQSQVRVKSGTPTGTAIENVVQVTGNNFAAVTAVSAAIVVSPGSGGGGGTPLPPTSSPSPSATPPPSGTPGPLPTATPIGTPPPATPPVGPPTVTPPPGPFVSAVDRFSRFFDDLFDRLFDLLGPTAQELCGQNAVQTIACSATAIGIAAALAAIVAALIQKELAAALFSLFQVFGLKRKARVWGVIYDTSTKRAVPLAKVELYDEAGRLLETRFADNDGRYGFLTSPASVRQGELKVSIRAYKPGYAFPSTRVAGDVDYIVYDRLYKGGILTLREGGLVNYNIPMDPVSERRAALSGFGRSLVGTLGDRLLAFGFYIGLIVVPLNYFLLPTTANLVILVAFLLVNLFRLFVVYRPYGMTLDAATRKPLAYALVTLNDSIGTRVAFAVSDEHGRFILSGKPGETYELTAYTPANVQPQRMTNVRTRGLRGRGWITQRVSI